MVGIHITIFKSMKKTNERLPLSACEGSSNQQLCSLDLPTLRLPLNRWWTAFSKFKLAKDGLRFSSTISYPATLVMFRTSFRKLSLFSKYSKVMISSSNPFIFCNWSWVFRINHQRRKNLISMDPSKLKEILDWPAPTTVKEARSFIGFCNFY